MKYSFEASMFAENLENTKTFRRTEETWTLVDSRLSQIFWGFLKNIKDLNEGEPIRRTENSFDLLCAGSSALN